MKTLFKKIRVAWLIANLDQETIALCKRAGITIPRSTKSNTVGESWGELSWHLHNRISAKDIDFFLRMFPQYQEKKSLLEEYIKSFDLSILPLNLLLPEGVNKFLPRLGMKPAPDPYGVQRAHSVVLHDDEFYLATRKPGYATLLPILGSGAGRVYCPIGCAGCYRGPQTRFNEPLRLIHDDGSEKTLWIPRPNQQMKWLVQKWNSKPKLKNVYDVLLSGGEPMMLSNSIWQKILHELKSAKYLRSLRICTGALFLGLPFRFDNEFIQLLVDFRKETGVQVKLSVHVSHPEHVTPEAVFFARKLLHAGIELLPQIPLEPGVNFWVDDLNKTVQTLTQLNRLLATVIGTRPYKWIFDMQGGIPLLPALEVWRRAYDAHQGETDLCRPTSFALFNPTIHGNVNLSYHSLWAIQMQVGKNKVIYRIPHPAKVWVEYEEPIWEGINDDPTKLENLKI